MDKRHKFSARVFFGAGIYGVVTLLPQIFLEAKLGRDFPPPLNHPEHFYGFIGVALAWQLVFLLNLKAQFSRGCTPIHTDKIARARGVHVVIAPFEKCVLPRSDYDLVCSRRRVAQG